MVLLICAVLGAFVGYRLGPSRHGFVTVALVSIGSAAVQIGHLLATTERSSMTMLPLVVGTSSLRRCWWVPWLGGPVLATRSTTSRDETGVFRAALRMADDRHGLAVGQELSSTVASPGFI